MITVIGMGSWGSALSVVLAANGHKLCLYNHSESVLQDITNNNLNSQYLGNIKLFDNLSDISTTSDLNQAITKDTKAIVLAIPSEVYAEFIDKIKDILHKKKLESILIISATKGLVENHQGEIKWLSEIVAEKLGDSYPFSILSGPSFAKEVALKQPTAVVIASSNTQYSLQASKLFHNNWFRVYRGEDIIGVQLGGAVKNILAFVIGCAEGYGFGCNSRAALITRGLHEMLVLGSKLKVTQDTLIGLSGLGDLVLTSTDNQSRNRLFGVYLGQGLSITDAKSKVKQYVACIDTTKLIYQLAQKYPDLDMPLTEQAYNILYNNMSIKQAAFNLSNRPQKSEFI